MKSLEEGVSRYGAGSSRLSSATAVLRAKALAHGLELKAPSAADLAASAIGADAWMLICGTDSFDLPLQYGEPAVRALAAVLARAAGHSEQYSEVFAERCAQDPELIRAAESHARWASLMVGPEAPEALRRAASDLYAAGPGARLSFYAELLCIVADGLELPRLFG